MLGSVGSPRPDLAAAADDCQPTVTVGRNSRHTVPACGRTVTPPPRPEARYEQTEAISLAFVTALQVLPLRQLAVRPITNVW